MKKRTKLLAFLFILIFLFVAVTGCGEATDPGEDTETEEPADEAVEEEVEEAEWPQSLTLGSASVGGAGYVYMSGWAELISSTVDVPSSVEATGGPNHNIQLVQMGDIEIGLASMGPLYEAWHGLEDWTGGLEHRNVRAIYPAYTAYMYFWTRTDSGISSLYDLEGVNVGVGPAGGTPGTYLPRIFEFLEINTNNIFAAYGDIASQQIDGLLPAAGIISGVPYATVTETETQLDLDIWTADEETQELLLEEFPFFAQGTMPQVFSSQAAPMETLTMWLFIVCEKDLPDSLVYEIVKSAHENHVILTDTHASAKDSLLEYVVHNRSVPFHPGAIKYFEEQGIELPDTAYPPEWNQ